MLAFFGLGLQEILLLAFLGAIGLGVALVILVLSRSSGSKDRAALEEENRQLREELDRREKS